jgi:hypothetical protein
MCSTFPSSETILVLKLKGGRKCVLGVYMNQVSMWVVAANRRDQNSIRWSVTRSPYPIDLRLFENTVDVMEAISGGAKSPDVVLVTVLKDVASDILNWRRDLLRAQTPVVVRCGSEDPEAIRAAYDAGANAYIMEAHELSLIDRDISGIAGFFGRLPRLERAGRESEEAQTGFSNELTLSRT